MSTIDETKTSGARQLDGLRILVVDDEPDARVFIRTILENHGATTLQARDGDEALEVLRREMPDVMTLDLGMPGRNGIEVFRTMREDYDLRGIPICVVTGRPELRALIYERSAWPPPEGYVDKPFDEQTLLIAIRKIVELGRKRLERLR